MAQCAGRVLVLVLADVRQPAVGLERIFMGHQRYYEPLLIVLV